jgi:hypothetical protein
LDDSQEKMDLIDGSIGEGSYFHHNYGYYAQGVSLKTSTLPKEWEKRLEKIQNKNTDLRIGYCLDPNDLAVAKLIAHRPKYTIFVHILLEDKLIDPEIVKQRLETVSSITSERISTLKNWIDIHLADNTNKKDNKKSFLKVKNKIS